MSPLRIGETLIAGRYRPVRFIAQGGMGEVYEAFDEELKQRVAMKVVRPDVAANPIAMERFKREISLARRVTHPNVSRIFEFGKHTDADGTVTFLTMELLDGPTLEERIRIEGPLKPPEALPLVEQICAGLSAAHDAGVVHRDLKSSNVMLVKAPDGGVRVVLTDFGLARAVTGDDAATITLTSTDLMVGTPAYMSPEQAQGFELTPRSDLYSLGVVLFEMVTGKFPHAGATPMAILMSRLKEPPPSPLLHMPALEPLWDSVIRRCLEVKADRRFPNAREIVRALKGEAVEPPPPLSPEEEAERSGKVPQLQARKRRRRALGTALGALVAVAAGAGIVLLSQRGPAGAARAGRRSAAVLGFKNLSGRPDSSWLSTALAEMLTAELAAGEQVRTVPGETVARARAELALPEADALSPATLVKVGSVLGTDVVVLGSYFVASQDPAAPLRVDLRVQDASGRGQDAVISETGTPGEVLTLVSSLGRKLRGKLGVGEASPQQAQSVRAAFPESAEAQRLFAEGLSRLRSFDLVEARKLLEDAASVSPKNPLIRSALASCYGALGDDARSRNAAQAASDLAGPLSREERLLFEAQLAEAKKEWPKAIEDYRALYRFFPDDVEYALRLAGAQTASGHARDALATIAEAAKLGHEPRVALAEGSAQMALSRYKLALGAAHRCVEAGSKSGTRLLTAQGRMLEADALVRLGDHRAAFTALEVSRKLFAETGDRNAEARAINRLANLAFEQGDYARSRKGFEEAGARWHEAGNVAGEMKAMHNVADSFEMEGDLRRARPLFDRVIAGASEVGNRFDASLGRSNLGYLLLLQGDARAAAEQARAGLSEARETGSGYPLLVGLYVSGRISFESGDPESSRAAFVEARALAEQIGEQRFAAYAEEGLGDLARLSGDLAAARGLYERALRVRRAIGGRAEIAESLTALARLAGDEGRTSDGIVAAKEAIALARGIGFRDGMLAAEIALARLVARTPSAKDSEQAITQVRELSATTQNVLLRLDAALAFASSAPDPSAARRRVEEEARSRGLLLLARLAARSGP